MRKDYSEIENILSKKAQRLESDIDYSGAMFDSKDAARIERAETKKEKRSIIPDFPGRQIVSAVLAAVLVSAGTFGTLKYLEFKGAQNLERQGSHGDDIYGDKAAATDEEGVMGRDAVDYQPAVDVFDRIVVLDLPEPEENEDPLDLDLMLGHNYAGPYAVNCEDANELGYSIYRYKELGKTSDSHYGLCIMNDVTHEIVMDFEPENMLLPPTRIWYADKTPSGHPTMFFTVSQGVKNPAWYYNKLYSVDLQTKELQLVCDLESEIKEYPYTSGEISYDSQSKTLHFDLFQYFPPYEIDNIPVPEISHVWSASSTMIGVQTGIGIIKYDAGAYTVSFEAVKDPEETTNEIPQGWTYDPTDYVTVVSGGSSIKPVITFAVIDGYEETYDLPVEQITYDDPFVIQNNVRTAWSCHGVAIGDEENGKGFGSIGDAEEYIKQLSHSVKKDMTLRVTVYLSWNAGGADLPFFGFTFDLLIKGSGKNQADVKPTSKENFIVTYGGDPAAAPVIYSEWEIEENERVNKVYYTVENVPVLDLYSGSGKVEYTYDADKIRLVNTVISRFNWDGAQTLDKNADITYSLKEHTDKKSYSTSLVYVEAEFERLDGSGKYVSFVYAVSSGDPGCYPYSNAGDGLASLTVSDGNNVYAPKGERIRRYDGDDNTNHHMFNSVLNGYYKVPELTLENGLQINMKDGFYIDCAVAFPGVELAEREVYYGVSGKHINTWMSQLPWNEFYVGIILDGDIPEALSEQHRIAYVIKVRKSDGKAAATADVTEQKAVFESWLKNVMQNGMTEEELLNSVIEEKDLKAAIIAMAYDQKNVEADGTFIRYKTKYCDFLYFAEKGTFKIREARLILKPGTNFSLPYGLTLDMSAKKALLEMGFTEQQIKEIRGEKINRDGFIINYTGDYLTVQYTDNGVAVGLEFGTDANAYVEMG